MLHRVPAPVRSVVELVLTVAIAIAIAVVAQAYVVKPYKVPSESMENTLMPGDRVLVDRVTLRFRDPQRGEIVVFHPPSCPPAANEDDVCDTPIVAKRTGTSDQTYIKRVIGLPGETLFSRQGHVWVVPAGGGTAHELQEPYTKGPTTILGRITVPAGMYFMMGDNRGDSSDSRRWGPEPRSDMIGIARFRYWPLSRIGPL
jgi:signal peptidase I